jgi:amino acid adenylation domain-containing protein
LRDLEENNMQSNVVDWLDEVAVRFPDKKGYTDEHCELTFSQVRRKALNLASVLVGYGIFKSPIAIYMEKGVDVLVAFFAVAYSGNFYSPIDVTMPESRVLKITEVLRPKVIVTKRELEDKALSFAGDAKLVFIDDIGFEENDDKAVLASRDKVCDTDLLYVLFTSGSTGTPKGVTITHRSVIDFVDCMQEIFHFEENDIFGNQAPFYFDLSILDVYAPIKTGAELHIIPKKLFTWPFPLAQYLQEKKITAIFWVPSAMVGIAKLGALKKVDLGRTLKYVLFCGEVMPNKVLNIWRRDLPDAVYANLYGPTEICDACTCYVVDREFSDEEPLPIGTAMRNTDIIVLNEDNKPVSGDEVGELCVRGTSLSMGYYKNPEKTREAFVQNPLNDAYPEIIYRTGDLVKFNEYGELMYASRKDFQIKHMGHRIELGEIETAVSSIDEISMNCCLYDEKRSKIVLFIAEKLELDYVNEKISHLVPEYMLPNRLIKVDRMPMNANGKIDRVKLKELI